MENEKFGKVRLMKLWEMLAQETDENNPMGTQEILRRLAEMGYDCTRKTLYADIAALNENGYEVMCNRSISNEYYVMDRKFDVSELRVLSDAVQAAGFVTEKKTQELVDKIAALGGSRSAEVLKQSLLAFNITKNTNESIFYNVSEIHRALNEKKKISFLYFSYDLDHERVYRRNAKKYVVNPIATVYSEDHYYLVCKDDVHVGLSHYRVDRMDKVTMLDKPVPDDLTDDVELAKHKKALFGMFVGKTKLVQFTAHNSLIDHIFDKFGDETKLSKVDDDHFSFTAEVQISPKFFGWCCSFGDALTVETNSVRKLLSAYLAERAQEYGAN